MQDFFFVAVTQNPGKQSTLGVVIGDRCSLFLIDPHAVSYGFLGIITATLFFCALGDTFNDFFRVNNNMYRLILRRVEAL